MNIRKFVALFFTAITICASGQHRQTKPNTTLILQPAVKADAEKNFKPMQGFENVLHGFLIYENKVEMEFYEDDNLVLSSQDDPKGTLFKSFYLWKGDTLIIDGGIGLFGGGGYSIQVINGQAIVYHMVCSDEFPAYAYDEHTPLVDRLDVPCHDVKLILSEIPKKGQHTVIYGYVEFKSDNYFSGEPPRKKLRSNMKMFFKSAEMDL